MTVSPLDVSFVFAVTGAAMVLPWLALLVGAAFFALNWYLSERSKPEPE